MDFVTAVSLIGKYVEIKYYASPPTYVNDIVMPVFELETEGFVTEIVVNQYIEKMRFKYNNRADNNDISIELIYKYRVYEPSEWKDCRTIEG